MPTQTQIGNRDLLKIDLPMSDFLLTSNMSCNTKLDIQIITYCTRNVLCGRVDLLYFNKKKV